ncbi:hypothetical protein [Reinekea blandensis]|uniref:NAD synthetase n=1 Tax=Reinekea blandensis MED297 TaxID=314283 RepID=A4BIT6_9GAMM|nr:hypothetical protein [Reinekea blandensis]EAR07953.1 NAD synthetase [Reinekea sp. MED297] [Reinekea blandensis MED297]
MNPSVTRDPARIAKRTLQRFQSMLFYGNNTQHQAELRTFREQAYGQQFYQLQSAYEDWIGRSPAADVIYAWDGHRVVGQQCCRSFYLKVGEQRVQAVNAFNLYVDEAWKLKGLGVALTTHLTEAYPIVVCQGISDEAYAMYKRLNWMDLGCLDYLVAPLNGCAMPRQKGEGLTRRVGRSLVTVLSRLWQRTRLATGPNVGLKKLNSLTPAQVSRIKEHASGYIQLEADFSHLQWRFDQTDYRCWQSQGKFGEAILVIRTRRVQGTLQWLISEFFRDNDTAISPTLAALLHLAAEHGVDSLVFHGKDDRLVSYLKRWGFITRPHGARFMAYCRDELLREACQSPRNWQCTTTLSDLDFADLFGQRHGHPIASVRHG